MGSIDVGLALGVESMSAPAARTALEFSQELMQGEAKDCLQPMGQTSENVGKDFDITREAQDKFAAWSYQKAEKAQKEGWFDDEIVPIKVWLKRLPGAKT